MMATRARIVVQHQRTLHYVQGNNLWTANLKAAMEFEDLRSAFAFTRQLDFPKALQVVMSFGDERKSNICFYQLDEGK